jgi:hypothetical protein
MAAVAIIVAVTATVTRRINDMVQATRHMDFGTPFKLSDYSPVTFTVVGENFDCKPAIQGKVLLDFIADADADDGSKAAIAIRRFFSEVMPDKEFQRFFALIENSEYVFDMEELSKIAGWLVEQYSSRPKELSKSSTNGRRRSGTTSTAVAS